MRLLGNKEKMQKKKKRKETNIFCDTMSKSNHIRLFYYLCLSILHRFMTYMYIILPVFAFFSKSKHCSILSRCDTLCDKLAKSQIDEIRLSQREWIAFLIR